MCCSNPSQSTFRPLACNCGCGMLFRRFISSKEETERLEEYRDQLKKEIIGVEERIQELKSK